jgi:hypothetical protein
MDEKLLDSSGSQLESIGASFKFQPLFPAAKQSITDTGSMCSKDEKPSSHYNKPMISSNIFGDSTFQSFKFNSGLFSLSPNPDPSSKFTFSSSNTTSKDQATVNEANNKSTNEPRHFKFSTTAFPKTSMAASSTVSNEHLKKCMETIK